MKKHIFSMIFITYLLTFEVANLFSQSYKGKNIAIDEIEVRVDEGRERNIEKQIGELLCTQFKANRKENNKTVCAQVNIRQRSYYVRDFKKRNSLYVHYIVYSMENSERIFEDYFQTKGRKSIIAASVQKRKTVAIRNGIEKAIRRYNKNEAKAAKNGRV